MLLFSHRLQLSEKYKKWIRENNVDDSPFNVICFLTSEGLLDADKCLDYLTKEKEHDKQ